MGYGASGLAFFACTFIGAEMWYLKPEANQLAPEPVAELDTLQEWSEWPLMVTAAVECLLYILFMVCPWPLFVCLSVCSRGKSCGRCRPTLDSKSQHSVINYGDDHRGPVLQPLPKANEDEEEDHTAVALSLARCREKGIERGDIVVLGFGAALEYNGRHAVVQRVSESHCTVIVLDGSLRFGVGECWPSFTSVDVEDNMLRVGSRVVLDGFQGKNTSRMNGRTGTIIEHPREGHPTFIKKPTAPDRPVLAVCVRFDDLVDPACRFGPKKGASSMMIEPRFLVPYQEFVQSAVSVMRQCENSNVKMCDVGIGAKS